MQEALAEGDFEDLASRASDFLTSDVVIYKVKASKPLLTFSSKYEVVYKVKYAIKSGGEKQEGVKYYLFDHSALANPYLKRESNKWVYYLNFY